MLNFGWLKRRTDAINGMKTNETVGKMAAMPKKVPNKAIKEGNDGQVFALQ